MRSLINFNLVAPFGVSASSIPIGCILDIGQPNKVKIHYIYKYSTNEPEDFRSNQWWNDYTIIGIGVQSRRIMSIEVNLLMVEDPIHEILNAVERMSDRYSFLKNENYNLVLLGTKQVFK